MLTIVTQVVVDQHDPSTKNPTKYIGQFYSEEDARRFEKERGWAVKQDGDRGWRRVVPSPIPLSIVEAPAIRTLVHEGQIVIAAGGGGIPVYVLPDGTLEGMDAVIDKDRVGAVLAKEIGASLFIILTDVDRVAINYGTPQQQEIDRLTVAEAAKYHAEGHFPPGSMGPKIGAAIQFLKSGGKEVLITSIDGAAAALDGKTGTRIVA